MIFYYIRHGFPNYDPDELTPLGKRQAEAVGRRFASVGLDRVYTSSAVRAIETAQPTCEILRLEPTVLDWTKEHHTTVDFQIPGDDGKPHWVFQIPKYVRLFQSREIRELGDRWYDHPAFAEYRNRFVHGTERVNRESDAFFASLGYEHDRENGCYRVTRRNDERVALFAHQGFGKLFFSSMLDIPYPMFSTKYDFDFTGITVVYFPNDGETVVPTLWQVSDTSHLLSDGLSVGYQRGTRV